MTHRRHVSFFKILLDPSAPALPLPPDFARNHLENKTLKDPVIRSANGGHSWRIKIKKIGESLCFYNGWDKVVRDMELGFGDFLVFKWFVDESSFKMVVYGPNGCEKDLPPKVDDDDDDDDDVGVKVKEEEEDEDEFEDEDEDEDGEGYEEVNDDDDEEEEDEGEGDGEGDIDGHDGDPFFMLVMSKINKNMMRLPPEFADLAGIEEGTITVTNLDGKQWKLGVRLEKLQNSERYYLSAGWHDFRRSNDLCEGDECVFKFIRDEDKLLLARVTKNKRVANEVVKRKKEHPEQNSGEVPAKKVETRERGRAASEDGGGVEVKSEDECVEVVKRQQPSKSISNGDDIDGDDGDPFFMLVISKTHKTVMRLPRDFADLAGIEEGVLTVTNLDGKQWQLGVRSEQLQNSKKYCLSAGWLDFMRSNDLCKGDECVFKFIRNEGKLLLARVTKNKRGANVVKRKREQAERNSGEVSAKKVETGERGQAACEDGDVEVKSEDECVEVVKRPRGRPPKSTSNGGDVARSEKADHTQGRQTRSNHGKQIGGRPSRQI